MGTALRTSIGKIVVTPAAHKIHVEVDPGIVDLVRALLPPHIRLNRTRYEPHITTVRDEEVPRWEVAAELHGTPIPFEYDPRVVAGEVYWWLRVWSPELVRLRRSLGLSDLSELCRPPDLEDCFHITVGNTKR